MEVYERFSAYVKSKWKTAQALADQIGVTRQYVNQMMIGQAAIGLKPLQKIKEIDPEFDINYIIHGNSSEPHIIKEPLFEYLSSLKQTTDNDKSDDEGPVPCSIVKMIIEDHRREIRRLELIIENHSTFSTRQNELIQMLINNLKAGH